MTEQKTIFSSKIILRCMFQTLEDLVPNEPVNTDFENTEDVSNLEKYNFFLGKKNRFFMVALFNQSSIEKIQNALFYGVANGLPEFESMIKDTDQENTLKSEIKNVFFLKPNKVKKVKSENFIFEGYYFFYIFVRDYEFNEETKEKIPYHFYMMAKKDVQLNFERVKMFAVNC